jgi:VCBS repeat-containing protein
MNTIKLMGTEILDGLTRSTLENAIANAQTDLTNIAASKDFQAIIHLALGDTVDTAKTGALQQSWKTGDFTSLPAIALRPAGDLGGANGAYVRATDTIYLSRDFLYQNRHNPEDVTRVVLEEIGHAIDARVNVTDSPGDEGAIFSRLVLGQPIDANVLAILRAENDIHSLTLDGQTLEAEFSDAYTGNNLGAIVGGLQTIFTNLDSSLKTVAFANRLPLVGSVLKDTTDPALDFLTSLKNQITTLNTTSVSQVKQTLVSALGSWLQDRNGDGTVDTNDISVVDTADQVRFDLTLKRNPVSITGGIGFDLGLPGVGLTVSDNSKVKTDVGFNFNLEFGVDKTTGFFVNAISPDELKVDLTTTLPNFNATGTLGFLQAGIQDIASNPTQFSGTFGLDLQSNGSVVPRLSGQAKINLNVVSKIPTSSDTTIPFLPSIATDLNLQWGFSNADASNPLSNSFGNLPQLAFNNVSVNIGAFLSQFAKPILGRVQDALSPLKPVFDFLNQKLPLLDLSYIDLLNQANAVIPPDLPGAGLSQKSNGLQLINFLNTILNIPSAPNVAIKLGDFTLSGGSGVDLRSQLLKDINVNTFTSVLNDLDQALRSIGADSAADYLKNLPKGLNNQGPTFPLIQNPGETLKLLLGQDPDLFRWDLSDALRFGGRGGGFYGAGIGVKIDYDYSAGVNLILGYDTYGLRQLYSTNFTTPTPLKDGFYLVDLPTPEAYLNANFYAGGAVGFEGANISAGGAIEGNVNLEIQDPDKDGKLRPSEVDDCFLEGNGKIAASLEARLELGWGPFTKTIRFPIKKGTLLSFAAGCNNGDPIRNVLAKEEVGTLALLMGPRAKERVVNASPPGSQQDVAEYFVLQPTKDQAGRVDVLAFGAIVSYAAGSQIIADGGQQGDVIAIDGAIATPASLQGGAGVDQLMGGAGNDTLLGGDDDDVLDGGGGADQLDGGDGFDVVSYETSNAAIQITPGNNGSFVGSGGSANGDSLVSIEQIIGSNFDDTLTGDNADNTFQGGAGNDSLSMNGGNDLLVGGAGADILNGGEGWDIASYTDSSDGVNVSLLSRTASSGDAAGDSFISIEGVDGSQLADVLTGDNDENFLSGEAGDDQIFGNAGIDVIDGGRGNDSVSAGDGDDRIYGKNDSDTLNGDAGNDLLDGGAGGDLLNGGAGIDTANYRNSPSKVVVNLATGVADGGYKTTFTNGVWQLSAVSDAIAASIDPRSGNVTVTARDQFNSVENLLGSSFNDSLTGDNNDNVINPGLSGEIGDSVDGGGGNDLLVLDYSIGDDATTGRVEGGAFGGSFFFGGITRRSADGKSRIDYVGFVNIERLQITATSKDDILAGLLGDDILNGGAGNDILVGAGSTNASKVGNDVINGGDGDDEIANRDYNAAGVDSDLFDRFDGGAGNDILSADFSNQTADITFISGQSNNLVFADGSYAKNFEFLRNFTSGSGNDTIIQTGRLVGGFNFGSYSIENRFSTGAGNDTINSGLGVDVIDAGEGNDLLIVDYSVGDDATVSGLSGFVYPYSGSSLSSVASYSRQGTNNVVRDSVDATNVERYQITGTSKADSLPGWFGDDILIGGAGNDTITAFYGNDVVDAGSGDDEVIASFDPKSGNPFNDTGKLDQLDGGEGVDTLTAAFGNQTVDISFNSANPTNFIFSDGTYAKNFEVIKNLQTGSGNDTLIQLGRVDNNFATGAGNDIINPGLGSADFVDGGTGDDLVILDYSVGDDASAGAVQGSADNFKNGTFARPTADGFRLDYLIFTDIERFKITGTSKDDDLGGSFGNDILKGGAGNDRLRGNAGSDKFIFGSGRPFNTADLGIDTITDFEINSDQLVLDRLTFTAGDTFASVATDAEVASSNAFIVYSAATGNLFYNANGSADGLGNGGQFAVLSNRPTLQSTNVEVTSLNNPPVATNDSYSTDEDTPLTVSNGVLSNDPDPDGDSLIATVLGSTSNGALVLNPNGSFTYTPNANFNGVDSFTYQVSDGNGGTATGTVSLIINPVNDPATITGTATASVTEDTNVDSNGNLNAIGTLAVSDVDAGENKFSSTVISTPGNLGNLSMSENGTFSYTVANSAVQFLKAGQTKTDTFTVKSFDNTASQIVSILLNGADDTSMPPSGGTTGIAPLPINFKTGRKGVNRRGTSKSDRLIGSKNNDIFRAGSGNDFVDGKQGNDRLFGQAGNDQLRGGSGNDLLDGGTGSDRLFGQAGDDVLIGGLGDDILTGGDGIDLFVYNTIKDGKDVITDFNQVDLIDLRSILSQSQFSSATPFDRFTQFVQLVQVRANTEVRIDIDGNGSNTTFSTLVTLQEVSVDSVNSLNFVVA